MHKPTSLRNILIKNTYSSLENDLVEEVVIPLLQQSIRYDRGVGFFTSGWLTKAAKGILEFVKNKGKTRIIISPNLTKQDWKIIKTARNKDAKTVEISIEKMISELEYNLEHDTLLALSWLIKDNFLEFRFAVPYKKLAGGMFHSKLAIFTDANGDSIALHGSQNDSTQASLNEESISAFCSWNEGRDWFLEHKERFNNMWDKGYSNLRVLKIEEAEKEIIIRQTKKHSRPYPTSDSIPINESFNWSEKGPSIPSQIKLREYQEKAINTWFSQNRCGIFEMATGTGKTITAISAAVKVFQKEKKLGLIILVPYIHLVDQWIEELKLFGLCPIACYESSSKWKKNVSAKIREYNAKLTTDICLVATHVTASMDTFQQVVKRLNTPYLILGDEIHELGAENLRKGLLESATWRIGLSATPDRWYDENGTKVLRDYFGQTAINYELKEAIEKKFLTRYNYFPEKINLTEDEIEEYSRLSKLIAQLNANKNSDDQKIEGLLRKRADLIGKSENKIPHLLKILKNHQTECLRNDEKFQHLLFYCNKGTHKVVLQELSKFGLRVHVLIARVFGF
jgi:superfamily II DNA or RNA helicase